MLSVFTTIGAFVGLLTGIFTFWDRYAKGRPIAFLIFKKDGDRVSPRLCVSNPGDYSIFIRSTKIVPGVFFLRRDSDGIPGVIEGVMDGITYWPIEPKGNAEFVIADRCNGNRPLGLADQRVRVVIDWRRGSTTWLWQPPIIVRTRTLTIRRLAKLADRDER